MGQLLYRTGNLEYWTGNGPAYVIDVLLKKQNPNTSGIWKNFLFSSVWFWIDSWMLNSNFGFLDELYLVFKLDIGFGLWSNFNIAFVVKKLKGIQ